MALHLRTQHQFGLQLGDPCFDVQIVIGDQRLKPIELGGFANLARKLPAIGPKPHDGEPEFARGEASGCDGVAGVAENEDPLTRQVGRIDRARIPGGPRRMTGEKWFRIDTGEGGGFADEVDGCPDTDGHRLGHGLLEIACKPLRSQGCGFGVEDDIEVGITQTRDVVGARVERCDDIDVNADRGKQARDFTNIIAVAKAERCGAEQIAAGSALSAIGYSLGWSRERAHQLIKGFGRSPIFLALVGRKLQGNDRDGECQCFGQTARVVLDQLSRTRGAHQHRLRFEPIERLSCRIFE